MKKVYFLGIILLATLSAIGQKVRYLDPVFDSVVSFPNVQYGASQTFQNTTLNLNMDFYYPYGDSLTNRPLLVLAHGGSFVQGSRQAADIVKVCREMALRGYVCVSIQYRLGVNIAGTGGLNQEFSHAVWRATQDGRAAVRFLRKRHAEESNIDGIDTSKIFVGGISAGGVLGMHLVGLDRYEEIAQTSIDTAQVGDIDGTSGNPGYSWRARGVVNLCGAISNVAWLANNNDVAFISMHGTNDQTVPYKSDYFKFFGNPIGFLQGSFSIDSAAASLGYKSVLHTFQGADHVPFSTNALYMDTTIRFVSRELYKNLTGLIPTSLETIREGEIASFFPNPANSSISFSASRSNLLQVNMYSLNGQEVLSAEVSPGSSLDLAKLERGMYLIEIKTEGSLIRKRLILE